ncbi:MAG: cytochrome c family protein [Rhizomicrobium sp.]|jgi:cytochrome c
MKIQIMLAAAGIAAFAATHAQATGSASTGAVVFNRCAICHDNRKDGVIKLGPDLYGVVGRKAGTYPGFYYSSAMKNAGFVWTNDKLDAYITSPQQVVPGNKMAFAGIAGASQRADLIAYLDTLK